MAENTTILGTSAMIGEDFIVEQEDEAQDLSISTNDLTEIFILSAIALIGIIGNSLVILVYSKTKGQQTNAALYIVNLAMADLLTSTVIILLEISEFFKGLWPVLWGTDIQCQLYRIGRFLCLDVTVFLMMAIAIDRYIAVIHPLTYKMKCSSKRTKFVLFLLWVVALILATPVGINFRTVYGKVINGPAHGVCAVGRLYHVNDVNYMAVYVSLVLMAIPAITTGTIYTVLVLYVRKHNLKFATQSHDSNAVRKNHWKMAKVLLAVFMAYVICYTPYLVFYICGFLRYRLPQVVRQIFLELPYANSCVNPILYMLMNKQFRNKIWALIGCSQEDGEHKTVVSTLSSSKDAESKYYEQPVDTSEEM